MNFSAQQPAECEGPGTVNYCSQTSSSYSITVAQCVELSLSNVEYLDG